MRGGCCRLVTSERSADVLAGELRCQIRRGAAGLQRDDSCVRRGAARNDDQYDGHQQHYGRYFRHKYHHTHPLRAWNRHLCGSLQLSVRPRVEDGGGCHRHPAGVLQHLRGDGWLGGGVTDWAGINRHGMLQRCRMLLRRPVAVRADYRGRCGAELLRRRVLLASLLLPVLSSAARSTTGCMLLLPSVS